MKDLLSADGLPLRAPRSRLWVAYSGGVDSTALLHRLWRLQPAGLAAIHVHHGLQPLADEWARRARAQCRAWNIPLRVCRVQVEDQGQGPEAAARAARHAVFAALLRPDDWLVTAHHLDDQAETVLLRALRGTGIDGLGAMPSHAEYGCGQVWRPLLATPRAAIERYARAQDLAWIDDPHNQDSRYARSHLRHRVWPELRAHWPQAAASLARLAQHARDNAMLLADLAQQDAQVLGLAEARCATGLALPVTSLLKLSESRRRNLLRWLWQRQGWQVPDADWWQRLEREVLRARADATPLLPFAQGEARRYRDQVYLMPPLAPPPADLELRWARGTRLALPAGCGELRTPRAPSRALIVRFAGGGERLRPAGSAHQRSLKHLCQAAGIPVWVRERLPLIYDGARLISVAGFWNAAELAELKGFVPYWRTSLPGWPHAAV